MGEVELEERRTTRRVDPGGARGLTSRALVDAVSAATGLPRAHVRDRFDAMRRDGAFAAGGEGATPRRHGATSALKLLVASACATRIVDAAATAEAAWTLVGASGNAGRRPFGHALEAVFARLVADPIAPASMVTSRGAAEASKLADRYVDVTLGSAFEDGRWTLRGARLAYGVARKGRHVREYRRAPVEGEVAGTRGPPLRRNDIVTLTALGALAARCAWPGSPGSEVAGSEGVEPRGDE